MLSNPGTPFNKDGWADVLSDLRRLFLAQSGGSNDLNQASGDANQVAAEFKPIEVKVCVDGIQKTMKVMGTDPA